MMRLATFGARSSRISKDRKEYCDIIRMYMMSLATFLAMLSLLLGSLAKETYNFKQPTSRSHPIRHLQQKMI